MATLQVQAGTLPPPACYSTEQERADAYASIYTVEIPDTLAQWVISETTPAPEDNDKLWARVDSVTGLVVQAYKFEDGDWQPWLSTVQYFSSTGSAGSPDNYIATFSPPNVQLIAGQIFLMQASFTNTGEAQVTVDALTAVPLKKEVDEDLVAGEIQQDQMVLMLYDGTNFQVISTLTQIGTHGRQFITAAGEGDFTVPQGVKQITVHLVGAGGGGGSSGSCNGGGGGGYCTAMLTVTPGQVIPYEVGEKGIGGINAPTQNATNGGNTIFNTTIIANGGNGGDTGGGTGGGFSGGDFGLTGLPGKSTYGSASDKPSGGAAGFWMSRGATTGISPPAEFVQAAQYGGGGSGDTDAAPDYEGEDGADGLIIIEW